MENKGGEAVRVRIITRPNKHGIAKDISLVAEEGLYDAVIIGRRGITGLQELVMGSVTSNLLAHAKVIPLWVVDGRTSPGGVLVAADGSPGSLRAVEHAAHILSGRRDIDLGIVNIQPKLGDFCEISPDSDNSGELSKAIQTSNEKCMADFTEKANGILEKAGIEKKAVNYFSVKRKIFTGKAILNTFKDKGYNSLAVGMTGFGQSLNMGRVAAYLVQKISDGAVWVVP
jgi:nucleotide-binding universal stress UspA family protein